MPIQATYPGVYVEEIPSGVRTIIGVATSITAFIGRAPRGALDKAVMVNNFGDYIRLYGGLDVDSTMSYAVKDFYLNGGSRAIIVRIGNGATPATIALNGTGGGLTLEAASPGTWGRQLRAAVTYRTDVSSTTLFNLFVEETTKVLGEVKVAVSESFLNVSSDPNDARYVERVLANESSLVHARLPIGGRPDETLGSIPSIPAVGGGPILAFVNANNDGSDGSVPGTNDYIGDPNLKTGLSALDDADIFNLLCIPPPTRTTDTDPSVWRAAAAYCVSRRAMLIVDPARNWDANRDQAVTRAIAGKDAIGVSGIAARNAALYFPRVMLRDTLRDNQLDTFVPCGIVAGVMAQTDTSRGIWKAPAGIDAALAGVEALTVKLTDLENGALNPLGINCLRTFPVINSVVWGSRTLRGADIFADDYKYVPVRRLALYLEESLYRGTQWVVFEPNDEPLWAQIRLNVGAFMQGLFRQGAFQGKTPREAYLVKCDKETTTQADINAGRVNILVGFAPLKPAEFVFLQIQQLAGQIEV